jgi:hypothetical protein
MSPNEMKEGAPMYPDWEHIRPVGGIVLTMIAIIAWLVFIILFALYWSANYSLFQDIIVTVATLVITGLVIGIGWVVWGFRHVRQWKKP